MNKKIVLLLYTLLFIISSLSVTAYPVTIRLTSNVDSHNTEVYKCTSSSCTSYSHHTSDSGNPTQYTISGSGNQYFAEYNYKSGYLPHAYITSTTDSTGSGPWDYDIEFTKKSDCYATINSLTLSSSSVAKGTAVTITANIQSAVDFDPGGPQSAPDSLADYYSAYTNVSLKVNGTQVDSKAVDINASSNQDVQFTYTPTSAGSYTITIETNLDDELMCSSSQTKTLDTTLTVTNTAPVAAAVTATTNEDTAVTVTLSYTDVDTGDQAETCSVTNVNNGAITTACACAAGVCTVGLTPSADSTASITADYTVNDGDVNSNSATITVTVTAVNDAPSVQITNPTQGATLQGIKNITWTATDVEQAAATLDIMIEYMYNGTNWIILENGTDNNNGTFTWDTRTVPSANDYQLRITATDDNSATGTDTVTQFTIGPNSPVVNITSPQVGDVWNSTRNILWIANDTAQAASTLDILIEYRNDGVNWVTLENLTDNNDGTFTWNTLSVPDDNDYELRITATNDVSAQGTDYINQFTIRNGPTITGILDQNITEDSGLNDNLVDLYTYTTDPDDLVDTLIFSIISESNATVVDCSLDSNRYIDCTTQQDQNGFSDVTVQASDPTGRNDTDTFRVNVLPVNDAPILSTPLADMIIAEDGYNDTVDLDNHFSDIDSTLTYWATSNETNVIVSIVSGNVINVSAQNNWNGIALINITAGDGEYNISDDFTVTVTPFNDAPVWDTNIADVTLDEDFGAYTHVANLSTYVSDVEGNIITFSISSENALEVDCEINGNQLILNSVQDWNGTASCTVRANDNNGGTADDAFLITVIPFNDAPVVNITHPDATHNNFVVGFDVNLMASATDIDSTALTYNIDWGDGITSNGNVVNDAVSTNYVYPTIGTYTINLTVSDGNLTDSDTVDIVVWPYEFNITNLNSYNNSDFTNQDAVFYRNDPLYIKFNVIQKDSGFLVPDNLNSVYMYDRDSPSNTYDLTAYNGDANGVTIVDGQPSTPDGSYYYYMPNLPITDDILGWNIVFVFSYDGTNAGQEELEIQILNNPVQLSDIPNVNFEAVNFDDSIDLDDYVYDLETPDNEITWSYAGNSQVSVSIAADNVVTFTAPATWVGTETITFIADDNDGSTVSDNVVVSAGVPAVTVLTPNGGELSYATYNITWTAIDYQNDTLTITLEYSSDGINWVNIASNEANDGIYTWNISSIPQGNYSVRVSAFDGIYTGYDTSDSYFTILSTAPSAVSVNIIANPSSGEVPLTVSFSAGVIGNAPFNYAWDLDGDGDVDSTDSTVTATYNEAGEYTVSLTVTDFDGDSGTDTQVINVNEHLNKEPKNRLRMDRVSFISGDVLRPGDDLILSVDLSNIGNYDLDDLKITASVDDIDARKRVGPFDLDNGDSVTKRIVMNIPEYAQEGEHTLRLTISNGNGFRRVKHRPFFVI